MEPYLQFWGKAGHGGDSGVEWHPLAYHSLDVAAVARVLCEHDAPADAAGVAALVALHDIGKFTRPFQGKIPALWPAILSPFRAPAVLPRHDTAGYAMLARAFDGLDPILAGWRPSERNYVYRAVTGHHGRPPEERDRIDAETACEEFSECCSSIYRCGPLGNWSAFTATTGTRCCYGSCLAACRADGHG